MTRNELFLAIIKSASSFVPGGLDIKSGIEALLNRNDDPSDNVDEISDALAKIVFGVVMAVENIQEKDYIHDEALKELLDNLRRDIKLVQQVLIRPVA